MSHIFGVFTAVLLVVHTIILGGGLILCIPAKVLAPKRIARFVITPLIEAIATAWIAGLIWWLRKVYGAQWDIDPLEDLSRDQWYLVTANHQSWADIFVLYHLFLHRAPLLKFFIKQQLLYVPIVGQAWWALDFPFMKRYTREYLEKHPEKAGQDLVATKRACEEFSHRPTSVMSFLEGTRFTEQKHAAQNSPYRNLLKPKAGGITFTIQALGDRFPGLTDVTIVYEGRTPSFWDLMCGRVPRVIGEVRQVDIPDFIREGDYENDEAFRQQAKNWLAGLWQEKDARIDALSKPSA